MYPRNIQEISKKYPRSIQEISKKYPNNIKINLNSQQNITHKTNYHRPMAFKGTNKIKKDGTKRLIKDFCTSSFNLNKSKWNKPEGDKTPARKQLERIREVFHLEVSGMNLVL